MRRLLAIIGTALAALVLIPGVAQADDQGNRSISHYTVDANAAKNGVVSVKIDFDFDFADKPGHGPYVTLPMRQRIAGDPDHWRSFTITDIHTGSPSGAPAKFETETDNGALAIKIGDENKKVRGVQSYELSYRISGVVSPGQGSAGADEIFWNIIGQQWEIPLHNITMNLVGPAEVGKAACYVGKSVNSSTACSKHQATADGATFNQDLVEPGSALTVVADWPAGTFVGAEPKLTKRFHPGNMFVANPVTGGLAGALALFGGGALLWRARRKGRDQAYVGLTPGLAPMPGQDAATTGRGSKSAPVAVQFTPPEGVGPGEMGTLIDEVADPRDVTATVVDLAVRGYLRIEEVSTEGDKDSDWRLVKLRDAGGLKAYEQTIIDGLFAEEKDDQEVVLSDLGQSFAGTLGKTQKDLYVQVTDRGWFRSNPGRVRAVWYSIGVSIVVVGILVGIALALTIGWGLVGIGIVAAGLVGIAVAHLMPARTAAGTAVLAQSLGFKLYLETAEADQIRFEEGEDIFSRYLPYAIAFDVAERWAKIFAELAAQGHDVPEPGWYVGSQVGYFVGASGASFANSLSAFSSTATTAMTNATSGSSGGSGFSGGAGAGVGGGGGGGW